MRNHHSTFNTTGSPKNGIDWLHQTVCRSLLVVAIGSGLNLGSPGGAANIAPEGTAILGVNDATDADAGAPRFNAGVLANINDGNPDTRVDNWFGNAGTDMGQAVSFVGITWPAKRYDIITSLSLRLATFTDGGWFGVPGIGPGAGGTLTEAHLVEPTVQVSTNGGLTWTTVAHDSDYLGFVNGHAIGGGGNPNPTGITAGFFVLTPATEINGIRIIGTNGGRAGSDTNGFIGVFELEIQSEPSADTDGDGLPDSWEQDNGLNVGTNDADGDPDADGLTNLAEYGASTNPQQSDTDADGLTDGSEVTTHLTNPLVADSDGDGLSDGAEVNEHLTNPNLTDTDTDGLTDGAEVNTHHTNPLSTDTDGDGFGDALEVAQGSDPTNPSNFPNNLALIGAAILGTKESLASGPETEVPYVHAGVATSINDLNLTTRVDTWNGSTPGTVSFVGILWEQPLTNPVVTLELTLATFFDGGWFGVNGTGPGTGGALTLAHLVEPLIQVSTNGESNWVTVAHTSDYLTALNGHRIGGGGVPNPSSVRAAFMLNEPAAGIRGIRIIGTEGGQASGGFLGVFELAVRTPVSDSDNDGIDDAWERIHGLNVGVNDAAADPDDDGLSNIAEFTADTDPQAADTDGDGLEDGPEINDHNTNPLRADTDGDGLSDGAEVVTHGSNPLVKDTDGDGFSDGVEVAQGSDPANASSIPDNLALIGTGILGTKETLDTGIEVPLFHAGTAANINDANLATSVDTFNGGSPGTASFVEILWDDPVAYPILSLRLSLAIFFDGGWFGVNGVGPGTGGNLSAASHLTEPTVQVTTDGGAVWTTVGHTSDYLTALEGHALPTVDFGPPTLAMATFQLDEPQTAIDGIRIIGTEGGTASGGFLGVFELETRARVPQPARLSNLAVAGSQFRFEFDSRDGFEYVVQFKASVSDTEWQMLTTIAGDGTRQQVTDSLSGAQRIYRVRTQ